MHTVWRRNDGYVDASESSLPLEAKDLDWTGRNGSVWTFKVLLHTDDWDAARALIMAERSR